MEIRSTEEARQNVEQFVSDFIELLEQKKSIDDEIKVLKNSYKEEGVPVGVVVKVINKIKRLKKQSETEKTEEEIIQEWLESNTGIDDKIGALIAR